MVPGLAAACSGGEDLLIGGLDGRAEEEEGESDEAVNWTASDVMDLNLQLAEGTIWQFSASGSVNHKYGTDPEVRILPFSHKSVLC